MRGKECIEGDVYYRRVQRSKVYALCSEKNNLLLTSLPGIPVNSNANYRHYNFQVLLIFSEDF